VRVRMGILAVAFAVSLTGSLAGCSDDDPKSDPTSNPSEPSMSEVTIDCPEFEEAAQKITDAQTALYDGSGGPEAIDDLVAELEDLKEGAPKDIKAAIDDLAAGFRDAAAILANPTPKGQAELAELSEKLSADSQKITAYFTSECG
jgi:hypothetical protein